MPTIEVLPRSEIGGRFFEDGSLSIYLKLAYLRPVMQIVMRIVQKNLHPGQIEFEWILCGA